MKRTSCAHRLTALLLGIFYYSQIHAADVDTHGNPTAEQQLRDMQDRHNAHTVENPIKAAKAQSDQRQADLDSPQAVTHEDITHAGISKEQLTEQKMRIDQWQAMNQRMTNVRAQNEAKQARIDQERNEGIRANNSTTICRMMSHILEDIENDGKIEPANYEEANRVAEAFVTGKLHNIDINPFIEKKGEYFVERFNNAQAIYLKINPDYVTNRSYLYAFRAMNGKSQDTVNEYRARRSHIITGHDAFVEIFQVLASALSIPKNQTPPYLDSNQCALAIPLLAEIIDDFGIQYTEIPSPSNSEQGAWGCQLMAAAMQYPELARGNKIASDYRCGTQEIWGAVRKKYSLVDDGKPVVMTDMWSHAWWGLAVSILLADSSQYPGPWFSDIRNWRRDHYLGPAPASAKKIIQQALHDWFNRNATSPDIQPRIQGDCDSACDDDLISIEKFRTWDGMPRLDTAAEDPLHPEWADPTDIYRKFIAEVNSLTDPLPAQKRLAIKRIFPAIEDITDPALVTAIAQLCVQQNDFFGLFKWLHDPRRRPTGPADNKLTLHYLMAAAGAKDALDWMSNNSYAWGAEPENKNNTLALKARREWLRHMQTFQGQIREDLITTHFKEIFATSPNDSNDHLRRVRLMNELAPLARRESPVGATAQAAILNLLDRNEVEFERTTPGCIRAQILWERAKMQKLDDANAFSVASKHLSDEEVHALAQYETYVWLPLNPDKNLMRMAANAVSILPALSTYDGMDAP